MAFLVMLMMAYSFMGMDLRANEIEWISAPVGEPRSVSGSSVNPRMSADGRYVVFESLAALTLDDHNKNRDLYFYDRRNKTLKRILAEDPTRANGGGFLGRQGRLIAYHSYPRSAIEGEPPRTTDIFLFDRRENHHELITVTWDGRAHDGEALFPQVSYRNRYVLFTSNGLNLTPGTKTALRRVYLFDRRRRAMELVSKSSTGAPANRPSGDARMSRDGRFVAFKSAATNLGRPLPIKSLSQHLYFIDRRKNIQIRIDARKRGFDPRVWMVGQYDMDDQARTVVFEGRRRRMENPRDMLDAIDLFAFDRRAGLVRRLTDGPFAYRAKSPSLSADGRYLAFVRRATGENPEGEGLVVYDRKRRIWQKLVSARSRHPLFSEDGRLLAFESNDPALVPRRSRTFFHIFVLENPLNR